MEDMDMSEDNLEEIMFLLEDNVFVRWRIDFNFFNQSIYGRLFERNHIFGFDNRDMTMPEIKGAPNTTKLLKTGFFQKVRAATTTSQNLPGSSSSASNSLATIRRRRPQSSLVHLLQQREGQSWPTATQCYVNNIFLPNSVAYHMPYNGDRAKYCSTYSPDGRHLLVGSGDGHVTVYDTSDRKGYKQVARHKVDANSHTIFDIDVSPNGREFLVGSWHTNLYTCSVLEQDDINRNYIRSHQLVDSGGKMAVFSTCFSNDGTELLASATDGCIYVFDRARNQTSLKILQDSREDVNAVRFLESGNNNVIIGAGHNGIIEIWDRRVVSGNNAKSRRSVATLFGHFDGITYIDSKDDGRHFITNSKDQSVKLWDVRKTGKPSQVRKARKVLAQPIWNYADDTIPAEFYGDKKPMDGDCSVMTYRGHRVAKTLIRAKFSPAETTGNRFIYSGCATGRVVIYDTLTGHMVSHIDGHKDVVRDVDWHPKRPEIATASFDEKVNLNIYKEKMEVKTSQPLRRSRRIAAKRARDAA